MTTTHHGTQRQRGGCLFCRHPITRDTPTGQWATRDGQTTCPSRSATPSGPLGLHVPAGPVVEVSECASCHRCIFRGLPGLWRLAGDGAQDCPAAQQPVLHDPAAKHAHGRPVCRRCGVTLVEDTDGLWREYTGGGDGSATCCWLSSPAPPAPDIDFLGMPLRHEPVRLDDDPVRCRHCGHPVICDMVTGFWAATGAAPGADASVCHRVGRHARPSVEPPEQADLAGLMAKLTALRPPLLWHAEPCGPGTSPGGGVHLARAGETMGTMSHAEALWLAIDLLTEAAEHYAGESR